MTEPTTEDIQEWYDGNWRYICIPDKNTLIGILLKRLKDAEQTHKTLLVCAMDDQDKLEAAEQKLRKFVWGENNPSEYVNALDKAEATIKEISELIAYYRDIDAENPDETIRMIAVADELQAALNRSKS